MSALSGNVDLVLHILAVDDSIIVVCTGPSGEAFVRIEPAAASMLFTHAFRLHRAIDALSHLSLTAEPPKKARRRLSAQMRAFGESLFDTVFTGSVLDLLHLAVGQAIRRRTEVSLHLLIGTDRLNLIPWELLCHQDTFISHVHDFVRHPCLLQPVRRPRHRDDIVRILFIGANPNNNVHVRGQIDAVRHALDKMTGRHRVTVLESPAATHTGIANAIYDGTDILHVLAHGDFDSSGSRHGGYFVIDGEGDRKSDRLPVTMLESFARAQPMQLAVLNACRSDQGRSYSARRIGKITSVAHKSLAYALIGAGVPCVIGMSHPVSKIGAEILTQRLYRGIAVASVEGTRAISSAMRQARLELFAHADDLLPSDWVTPVLYARSTETGLW